MILTAHGTGTRVTHERSRLEGGKTVSGEVNRAPLGSQT